MKQTNKTSLWRCAQFWNLCQINALWSHFLLISITQNDQTDTLLPFCQSGSHINYVPREVEICAIPALTCSKFEFLNWVQIPELTESAAQIWNWPCTKWERCWLWESYVIPLHSTETAVSFMKKNVEVLFIFLRNTLDQAFGIRVKLRSRTAVSCHCTLVFLCESKLGTVSVHWNLQCLAAFFFDAASHIHCWTYITIAEV